MLPMEITPSLRPGAPVRLSPSCFGALGQHELSFALVRINACGVFTTIILGQRTDGQSDEWTAKLLPFPNLFFFSVRRGAPVRQVCICRVMVSAPALTGPCSASMCVCRAPFPVLSSPLLFLSERAGAATQV